MQIAHWVLVPETRSTIMMDQIAKKRRKSGQDPNIYGPNELTPFKERFSAKEILVTWIRPFRMFLTEPIVLTLSLLSGFSDALIFMFIQSFVLVYEQWGFGTVEIGLAFIPIGIGYFVAWASFIPVIRRNIQERKDKPDDEKAQYESRLWWLLYTAPCLPLGLIGFAWTSGGPPVHVSSPPLSFAAVPRRSTCPVTSRTTQDLSMPFASLPIHCSSFPGALVSLYATFLTSTSVDIVALSAPLPLHTP